jgi:GTPase involved in cell partitioning and DNA repair
MVEMVVVRSRLFSWNKGLWTLFHLKFTRHIKAGNGGDGRATEGWEMEMIYIEVPLNRVKIKETEKFYRNYGRGEASTPERWWRFRKFQFQQIKP